MSCGPRSPTSSNKGKGAKDTTGDTQEDEDNKDRDNGEQTPTEAPTLVKTGIAAWDDAVFDEAQSIAMKKRAQETSGGAASKAKVCTPTVVATTKVLAFGEPVVEQRVENTENASPGPAVVAVRANESDKNDGKPANRNGSSKVEPVAEERNRENEGRVRGDSECATPEQGVDETTEDRNDLPSRRKQPNNKGAATVGSLLIVQTKLSTGKRPSSRRWPGPSGLEKALKLATRCIDADGFHSKAYALRGELQARLGRKDRAIADYEAAALLERTDPRSQINQVYSWNTT